MNRFTIEGSPSVTARPGLSQYSAVLEVGDVEIAVSHSTLAAMVRAGSALLARPVAGHDDGGVKGARDD